MNSSLRWKRNFTIPRSTIQAIQESVRTIFWTLGSARINPIFGFVIGLMLLSGASSSFGGELTPEERSILRSGTSESWYSVQDEATQPLEGLVGSQEVDVSDRNRSIFTPKPPAPSPATSNQQGSSWWDDFWDWASLPFFGISLFGGFLRLMAALILAAAIAGLIYYLLKNDFALLSSGRKRFQTQRVRDQIRVTDLPFELEASPLSLLEQSDAYRRKSDFSKAMIYYFSHILVELDEAGLIRLTRGKTNRIYLRELRGSSRLGQYLKQNIEKFERVFFGRYDLDGGDFESLRDQLPQFMGWVQEANAQLHEGKRSES